MHELSSLGALRATRYRPGSRVPIATRLAVGGSEFDVPAEPRLLLVPGNVRALQKMWDGLRMPSRNNLLVTGESGTGKTLLVRYLAAIYREVLRQRAAAEPDPAVAAHIRERSASFQARVLTFHENLRRSDITERRHYGETGQEKTGWTMSDVMDGMVVGDWNILSEINRTGEDVWAEFNDPLENKQKTLHQQVIRGHPDSRFIATANPVKGEGRGIYEGKVMSGEFLNRFTNKVQLSFLPPDEECEVLRDYGPHVDEQVIARLVALSNDIRRDYAEEHGVVPFPVTTRALVRVVRHLERFPSDTRRLRSLFRRKAYWLDDRIHSAVAIRLVEDLLDLHGIIDGTVESGKRPQVARVTGKDGRTCLRIGDASHPLGTGGPYVPDTVIEEVPQNLADLEWVLKDMVLCENVLLIGEAGVGKNKLESYLAHLLTSNLLVIGMSGETRVSDLLTYRSFGEEEEGRTGDTSTLGLRALTDTQQSWMIVLDEANKASPGVLVSFNDLLQDRLARLPGGMVAPVHAGIFVNINPNRPPYEVNDFSFEFMDRFSIHTVVHLPADQAVDVLARKYPGADLDFVRDVVSGYYALHPLYSAGVLFEPVTMRNEEAAIERALQYPNEAANLIDLLSACYGPRDARELQAIQSCLQAAGFDRGVLPSPAALEAYRESWDEDPADEGRALALAATFRAIGKPSAALKVMHAMLSRHAGRDWLYRSRNAAVLLDTGREDEAAAELKRAFATSSVVRMNNGADYRVLYAFIEVRNGKARLSIEARTVPDGRAALVISGDGTPPPAGIRRAAGEFVHTFTDVENDLVIYEQPGGAPGHGPEERPGSDDAGEGPREAHIQPECGSGPQTGTQPEEFTGHKAGTAGAPHVPGTPPEDAAIRQPGMPDEYTGQQPGTAEVPPVRGRSLEDATIRQPELLEDPGFERDTPGDLHGGLSALASEAVTLVPAGAGFHRQLCRLPSPPWTYPAGDDGGIRCEFANAGGMIRLCANPGRGWSVEVKENPCGPVGSRSQRGGAARTREPAPGAGIPRSFTIGWTGGEGTVTGRCTFTGRHGGRTELPLPSDPYVHLAFSREGDRFMLVLPEAIVRAVRKEGACSPGTIGTVHWAICTPEEYRETVLAPLLAALSPRLERLVRYARRVSGPATAGAGDVLYAISPESGVSCSLVLDIDGTGPVLAGLPKAGDVWVSTATCGNTLGISTEHWDSRYPLRIPFSQLDSCEEWLGRASSPEMQAYLREVREYLAASLFSRTGSRDLLFEGKARAVIAGLAPGATPVEPAGESMVLCRGDILVRTGESPGGIRDERSVLIVRFLQYGPGGLGGDRPVVRGFWLGAQNPVATLDLDEVPGRFGRIVVEGDDKYLRIVRRLSALWQQSDRPFAFTRTGSRTDPVIRCEALGLRLVYHLQERRFRMELEPKNGDGERSIEESGYPAGYTTVSPGDRGLSRWQGLPLLDICTFPHDGRVTIVFEDEFCRALDRSRWLPDGPEDGLPPAVGVISRTEAERLALLSGTGTRTDEGTA